MRAITPFVLFTSIATAPLVAQTHDFTPYLIADRGEEVALARSAAPPRISDSASVYVMTDTGYVEVAKGTNGFTCFVIRSLINTGVDSVTTWQPQLRAPHCFNAQATRTALPNILYRTRSILRGVPAARIEAGVRAAYASHRWPTSEVGAMVYMLSPRQWLTGNNTDWSPWKPHLMFFFPPGRAPASWGALEKGNSTLIDAGPNPYGPGNLILVPVEQWSDGTPFAAGGSPEHQH
jgi:hypothetical protein